ncbi:MAG: ATP-binding protein [Haloarculaceae archaeon]
MSDDPASLEDALSRAAFDALPSEAAVIDADGVVRVANDAWKTFDGECGIVIGTHVIGEDYTHHCRGAGDHTATMAADGIEAVIDGEMSSFAFEYPFQTDEEERWFAVDVLPFTVDGERFVLVVHTNITDRHRAEEVVSDRSELLEAVAGILSHDLRNPLTVALARTDMLEDDEHSQAIRRSLERMSDIIEDALLLAHNTDIDRVDPVEIDTCVEAAWDHVRTEQSELVVDDTRTVQADASLLMQLFENLFRNSIEHADSDADGTAVTITVGTLEDGFYVEDDGLGIPEERREDIFEMGYTTAREGTGLGLGIVGRIVDAHGWSIRATEGASGGARFEITGVASGD